VRSESDDDLDIEPADGVEEVRGAIRRRRKEQQDALQWHKPSIGVATRRIDARPSSLS